MSRARRLLLAARRIGLVSLYLAIIVAIALGSAGIVALWSHPPGTAARAELTFNGDTTIAPVLANDHKDLATVAGAVDRLAVLARGAIAALNGNQQGPFSDALTEGGTVAATIQADSASLLARLRGLPGERAADGLAYGAEVLARRAAMISALDATEGLGRSWATLTAGGLQASRLLALLADHDTSVAAAAAQGRAASYAAALATLVTATGKLDDAVKIRDQLANSADVSTLDEWIARDRRYDAALAALYTALRDSGGLVTDAVRTAFKEEGAARAQLPPDNKGLVVIVADIGRGGLNQAVIAIEQARGRLDLALEALTSMALPSAGPASG